MRDRNNQTLAQQGRQSAAAFAPPAMTRPTGPLNESPRDAAPPARPTVIGMLTEQEALIVRAHEMLTYLENNLNPVLAERPSSGGGPVLNEGKVEPPGVVRRVILHNQGIEFLIMRLDDIGTRLEL